MGLHRVRYRYMDSVTGYVSNPSDSVEVNIHTIARSYLFHLEGAPGAGVPSAGLVASLPRDRVGIRRAIVVCRQFTAARRLEVGILSWLLPVWRECGSVRQG